MFNIGPAELIVILMVALLIVGPKRLPEVGKSVGKALREIRRQTDEVKSSFEATINPDFDDDDLVDDVTGSPPTDVDQPVTEWGGDDDAEAAPTQELGATAEPDPALADTEPTRSRRRRRSADRDPGADAT
jgi:Tat protein translocase TatB subunit